MVLLTRLSPVFPFVLLNYLLGLTAVRPGAYALANLIGMLPAAFSYSSTSARRRAMRLPAEMDVSAGVYQQILKYVGLAATVAAVVLVTRIARKALREAERQQEGSVAAGTAGLGFDHKPPTFDKMMLVDDPHDRLLIENCRPSKRINPAPAKKYKFGRPRAGTAGLGSVLLVRLGWAPGSR